jgi:hypothetical protein
MESLLVNDYQRATNERNLTKDAAKKLEQSYHEKLMSELKVLEDPVPAQRNLRVRMDQENKSMVGERIRYRKSVGEIADLKEGKLSGLRRHDFGPDPTGLRRDIRCDIERHNRVLA